MRILIIGLGSIGQRHLQNIKKLNIKTQIASTSDLRNRKLINLNGKITKFNILDKYTIKYLKDKKEINLFKPDSVFVCNESIYHFKTIKPFLENNTDLFIEKPLVTNKKQITLTKKYLIKSKSITAVGFQERFNPAIIYIKKLLNNKNKIISGNFQWNTYLPNHRPWQNFKESYASKKELGGGVINSLSHELDLICNFFGLPQKVLAYKNKSILDIDAEENISAILYFKKNFVINLQLSFASKYENRKFNILSDSYYIEYDFIDKNLLIYNSLKDKKYNKKFSFKRNDLFKAELNDFIICSNQNTQSKISANKALESCILANYMHQSIIKKKIIKIDKRSL